MSDELYQEAKKFVLETGNASISAIQRHFRIGYNRAARIVEDMEKEGVVGPLYGSGKRNISYSKSKTSVNHIKSRMGLRVELYIKKNKESFSEKEGEEFSKQLEESIVSKGFEVSGKTSLYKIDT